MCQRKSRCAGGEDLLYSSCQIFSEAIVTDLLSVAGAERIMMGSGCCFDTAHRQIDITVPYRLGSAPKWRSRVSPLSLALHRHLEPALACGHGGGL